MTLKDTPFQAQYTKENPMTFTPGELLLMKHSLRGLWMQLYDEEGPKNIAVEQCAALIDKLENGISTAFASSEVIRA